MKTFGRIVGLLLVAGVIFYVYSMWSQAEGIKKLCAAYPAGTPIGEPRKLAAQFSVQFMGSSAVEGAPGTERYIYCAPLTMCDDSCTLDVENDVVKNSNHRTH